MKELPVEDAPGSGAVVADGDEFYLLDHCRTWHKSFIAAGLGGCLWKS
ncbi:MAG: hypothetical protein IJA91_05180 [Clostridia bacterium]|nr:hypothetical protein [Clostridia bacterium]